MRLVIIVFTLICMLGSVACVSTLSLPAPGLDHPANPEAGTTPPATLTVVLDTNATAELPAPQTSAGTGSHHQHNH